MDVTLLSNIEYDPLILPGVLTFETLLSLRSFTLLPELRDGVRGALVGLSNNHALVSANVGRGEPVNTKCTSPSGELDGECNPPLYVFEIDIAFVTEVFSNVSFSAS